jgi:hypothetical protein
VPAAACSDGNGCPVADGCEVDDFAVRSLSPKKAGKTGGPRSTAGGNTAVKVARRPRHG